MSSAGNINDSTPVPANKQAMADAQLPAAETSPLPELKVASSPSAYTQMYRGQVQDPSPIGDESVGDFTHPPFVNDFPPEQLFTDMVDVGSNDPATSDLVVDRYPTNPTLDHQHRRRGPNTSNTAGNRKFLARPSVSSGVNTMSHLPPLPPLPQTEMAHLHPPALEGDFSHNDLLALEGGDFSHNNLSDPSSMTPATATAATATFNPSSMAAATATSTDTATSTVESSTNHIAAMIGAGNLQATTDHYGTDVKYDKKMMLAEAIKKAGLPETFHVYGFDWVCEQGKFSPGRLQFCDRSICDESKITLSSFIEAYKKKHPTKIINLCHIWQLLPGGVEALQTAVDWGYCGGNWAARSVNDKHVTIVDPNGVSHKGHRPACKAAGMCVSNITEVNFLEMLDFAKSWNFPRGWTIKISDGRYFIYDPVGKEYNCLKEAVKVAGVYEMEHVRGQWSLICDYLGYTKACEAVIAFGKANVDPIFTISVTKAQQFAKGESNLAFVHKKVPYGLVFTKFVTLETEECRAQFRLAIDGVNPEVLDELIAKMAAFQSAYFLAKESSSELPVPPLRHLKKPGRRRQTAAEWQQKLDAFLASLDDGEEERFMEATREWGRLKERKTRMKERFPLTDKTRLDAVIESSSYKEGKKILNLRENLRKARKAETKACSSSSSVSTSKSNASSPATLPSSSSNNTTSAASSSSSAVPNATASVFASKPKLYAISVRVTQKDLASETTEKLTALIPAGSSSSPKTPKAAHVAVIGANKRKRENPVPKKKSAVLAAMRRPGSKRQSK